MKIACQKCKEIFDIPDDQKIDVAVCPFCEHKTELHPKKQKPQKEPKPKTQGYADPVENIRPRPKNPRHPLSIPMMLIALCFCVITGIIALIFIGMLSAANQRLKDEKEAEKVMQQVNEKLAEEMKKLDKMFNKTVP